MSVGMSATVTFLDDVLSFDDSQLVRCVIIASNACMLCSILSLSLNVTSGLSLDDYARHDGMMY